MAEMPDFNAKLWSQNLSAVLDRNRDMAACRKLKQDIEQTLKKTADGILLFNEFNKKMEESQVSMPESPRCPFHCSAYTILAAHSRTCRTIAATMRVLSCHLVHGSTGHDQSALCGCRM